MEITFITIHDLSPCATILYCSDSIVDILGYSPQDVLSRSSWDFFHPEEIPFARAKHGHTIQLDRAAVIAYCRLKHASGTWIRCEVVFTVVYDVLVGCISVYTQGPRSENRAVEAPVVRRMFADPRNDPRYHMLSHLSPKLSPHWREPYHESRAALFLNRYTRTLTIMYATDGLAHLLGLTGEEMRGHSFYYCIQNSCLPDAIRCLENAKSNDSIAYLRFWFRDPIQAEDNHEHSRMDIDSDASSVVPDGERALHGSARQSSVDTQPASSSDGVETAESRTQLAGSSMIGRESSGQSSGQSHGPDSHEAIWGEAPERSSSASSVTQSPPSHQSRPRPSGASNARGWPIELEAVISCTSDGLVVCLREARKLQIQHGPNYRPVPDNGLFAVPWSDSSVGGVGTQPAQEHPSQQDVVPRGFAPTPEVNSRNDDPNGFLEAIRECAIFAWAVANTNSSLINYASGSPGDESRPHADLAM